MIVFFVLLFFLGTLHTLSGAAMLGNKRSIILFAVLLAVLPLLLRGLATETSFSAIRESIAGTDALINACIIQILEAFITAAFSLALIRVHHLGGRKLPTVLAFLPSVFFVAGVFSTLLYVYTAVEGVSFTLLSMLVSGSVFLIFAGIPMLMQKVLSWDAVAEIRIFIAFFQIIIAMFLPVLASGLNISESQFSIAWAQAGLVLVLLIIVVGFSAIIYRLRSKIQ